MSISYIFSVTKLLHDFTVKKYLMVDTTASIARSYNSDTTCKSFEFFYQRIEHFDAISKKIKISFTYAKLGGKNNEENQYFSGKKCMTKKKSKNT